MSEKIAGETKQDEVVEPFYLVTIPFETREIALEIAEDLLCEWYGVKTVEITQKEFEALRQVKAEDKLVAVPLPTKVSEASQSVFDTVKQVNPE